MCALRGEQPGHLNVRAVLRHTVPNKGLHPLPLDLSGAVDCLDKLPQRIRGKRHQGIRISYDLVGFIPGRTAETGNGVTEATPFPRKYDITFL